MVSQKGFSAVELLLLTIAIALIAGTGFYVWHVKQNIDKTNNQTAFDSQPPDVGNKVSTYDECLKAKGSKLLETYPQICVTLGGQHFTQPTATKQKYLVIKEWGVKIPMSDKTADALYTPNNDSESSDMMHISTKTLEKLAAEHKGCAYGINDIYLARNTTANESAKNADFAHIGSYYYHYGSVIEPLCATQSDENNPLLKQINDIQKQLRENLKSISAQ